MSVEVTQSPHYTVSDSAAGPVVTWRIRNVQTGEWVEINGIFDNGSDVTNLPLSLAKQLGVDTSREEEIQIHTVGNSIKGYYLDMEYQFADTMFKGPVVFRDSNSGPLFGRQPLFNYFDVYIDNQAKTVTFIPINSPFAVMPGTNSIMQLKYMVAVAICGIRGVQY